MLPKGKIEMSLVQQYCCALKTKHFFKKANVNRYCYNPNNCMCKFIFFQTRFKKQLNCEHPMLQLILGGTMLVWVGVHGTNVALLL